MKKVFILLLIQTCLFYCRSNTAQAQVATSGLIAYLPFHYGFSADSSSLNLPVTSYYVTGAKDRFGNDNQSIHFFGASSDVNINISNHLEAFQLQEFTINIWFSAIEDQLTPNPVLVRRKNLNGIFSYNLDLSTAGMRISTNANGNDLSCSASLPSFEQWTMMSMLSSADSIFLYKNAILVSSIAKTDTISYTDQLNFISIGSNGGGNSQVFSGFLDDFRMYNRVLSPFEINQLYEEQSSVSTEELLKNSISIFPNPVQNKLHFNHLPEHSNIRVYELTGKLLLETENVQSLDLETLPDQMYFLVIETAQSKTYTKLFVKKSN